MKIITTISILLLISFMVLTGCSETNTEPENTTQNKTFYLSGTVKDANGNPVENAIVQLKFDMDTLKSRPATVINFPVPSNESVKLWVTRKLDGSLVKTLVDTVMLPGMHSVGWNLTNQSGKYVRNDMYLLNLKLQSQNAVSSLCYINNNITSQSYSDLDFFAKTDASGNYKIDTRQIPSGIRFDIITETQDTTAQTVSSKMNVWAIHPDNRRTVIQSVKISNDSDTKADLIFN